MINRVDDNCENCLQNLCYLLENLDLQCFFLKQCENVVYLSFDALHYLWSFPSVGHFLRKPPNLNSTLIYILSHWNENFIFICFENSHEENFIMKP